MITRGARHGALLARLLGAAERQGAAHWVLVDPDRTSAGRASALAAECEAAGVDALLFGSSTPLERDPDPIVRALRASYRGPIILFPGSAEQVRPDLDAVLFLSLLSGRDARYLIDEQVAAAPRVLGAGIEPVSTAYVLVGGGEAGSVARVTHTEPLPLSRPAAIVAHAQAAACLGFSLLYLEAGSGAATPVPTSLVRAVADAAPIPIVVGGGIRDPRCGAAMAAAGARFVVTGTAHEAGAPVAPFTSAIHLPASAVPGTPLAPAGAASGEGGA